METVVTLMLMGVAGAIIGLPLRNYLSVAFGRRLLLSGASALLLGLGAFTLAFAGWVNLWAAASIALVLFGVGVLVVPMSLVLIWPRSQHLSHRE